MTETETKTRPAWSVRIGEAILSACEQRDHPKMANKWGYVSGMALMALGRLSEHAGEPRFMDVLQHHMELFITEDGGIRTYRLNDYNLDHINQGKNLFLMHEKTGDAKYEKAISLLVKQLIGQPRTSEGGFWHKKIYPYQMWLDGVYMSSPFLAEYARRFGGDRFFDEVALQILLIESRTRIPETGLLCHAWDESREQQWCDRTTGRSLHVWGRAMGWYAMAVVDALDHFPEDHPKRGQIMGIFHRMAHALKHVQDQESGLWYQVMDQNGREGNYLEASASCMLTYALAKGIRKGYVSELNPQVVQRAYQGILDRFVTEDSEGVHLHGICHGAGLGGNGFYRDGSYAYYLSEEVVSDALMGVAPFLLASIEMEKLNEANDREVESI
ncbi:glycoside hydrolase family 88/105 protein [Paenibacillus lemnae]|uniref:Glycosyl hydrolase family 88 n=1 Tax=Paenibacillus lemnae TaxID=1330551 RepID=A0A848M468_PAELE|nr:glycoside hydrolase family 88 protein [Paenibacillus lemnae]NMO95031.1 glycosyl hydrolase family 88 [Paenibacillus lemnae]